MYSCARHKKKTQSLNPASVCITGGVGVFVEDRTTRRRLAMGDADLMMDMDSKEPSALEAELKRTEPGLVGQGGQGLNVQPSMFGADARLQDSSQTTPLYNTETSNVDNMLNVYKSGVFKNGQNYAVVASMQITPSEDIEADMRNFEEFKNEAEYKQNRYSMKPQEYDFYTNYFKPRINILGACDTMEEAKKMGMAVQKWATDHKLPFEHDVVQMREFIPWPIDPEDYSGMDMATGQNPLAQQYMQNYLDSRNKARKMHDNKVRDAVELDKFKQTRAQLTERRRTLKQQGKARHTDDAWHDSKRK